MDGIRQCLQSILIFLTTLHHIVTMTFSFSLYTVYCISNVLLDSCILFIEIICKIETFITYITDVLHLIPYIKQWYYSVILLIIRHRQILVFSTGVIMDITGIITLKIYCLQIIFYFFILNSKATVCTLPSVAYYTKF